MYNVKLVKPVGEGELSFYYNNSDRMEIDYQDLCEGHRRAPRARVGQLLPELVRRSRGRERLQRERPERRDRVR